MLIIVEGPNGVGKSTFVEDLRVRIAHAHGEAEVLHAGPPGDSPLEEYECRLRDYRPGGRDVICDRWYLGEEVYGPLVRDGSALGPGGFLHVELFMLSRGAVLVPLNGAVEELKARLQKRDGSSADLVAGETALFRRVYARTRLPKSVSVPSAIGDAYYAAEEAPARDWPGYVGPPRPKVLVVGDKVDGSITARRTTCRLPFMPFRGSSGYYLMEHLARHSSRYTVGVVNSAGCQLDKLVTALGGPHVVALGHEAHARLHAHGVVHGVVPHPQYIRRFHHHHGETYVKSIFHNARSGEHEFSWDAPWR